ncbi:hypothetical protein FJZ31_07070 [Candidatus Poribacteria bacterium]|nr:hypothetical protein [Candidatus Poribacteria bacterium]
MSKGKLLKLFGIAFCLICFFLIGDETSWFITEGGAAGSPQPKPFKATFQGEVTDFDFKTKSISVEGSAVGIPIGESTFTATGTIEDWNTGTGTVTIVTRDKSTITANLIGHLVGEDSFFGTYSVVGGTGRFQTAIGGSGIVSGTFDIRARSFQGQATGNIIY